MPTTLDKFNLVNFLLEDLLPEDQRIPVLKSFLDNPKQSLLEIYPDILDSDKTSSCIFKKKQKAGFKIVAKENGVVFGLDLALLVFNLLDPEIKFKKLVNDADKIKENQELAQIQGSTLACLIAERTALNLLSHLSGLATLSYNLKQKLKNQKTQILDTRKTLPGLRKYQKMAVKAGGCQNHRMALYDAVMLKDNHIDTAGGILEAMAKIKTYQKTNQQKLPIILEVRGLKELKQALKTEADRVLLDNFSLPEIYQAVILTKKQKPLEVSGNIQPENLLEIAKTGVDFISIGGSLTMNSHRLDLSMVGRVQVLRPD